MQESHPFNPDLIDEIAAELFWRSVLDKDFETTKCEVISSTGKCLFKSPHFKQVAEEYKINDLPYEEKKRFCIEVANKAAKTLQNNMPLNGIVYLEDFLHGRSPSAKSIDTSQLQPTPQKVRFTGPIQAKTGRLCIRHPLPAVVQLKEEPNYHFIEVADTKTALGFDYPVFLLISSISTFDSNTLIAHGVFFIPALSIEQGNKWSAVIQNSTRFIHRFCSQSQAGLIEINFG